MIKESFEKYITVLLLISEEFLYFNLYCVFEDKMAARKLRVAKEIGIGQREKNLGAKALRKLGDCTKRMRTVERLFTIEERWEMKTGREAIGLDSVEIKDLKYILTELQSVVALVENLLRMEGVDLRS